MLHYGPQICWQMRLEEKYVALYWWFNFYCFFTMSLWMQVLFTAMFIRLSFASGCGVSMGFLCYRAEQLSCFFCPCSAMSQCQDVPSDTSLCPLWRFSAKMIFSVFAVTERSLSVAGTIHPFFGDWYCSDIKSSVSSVSFSNASLISWRIDPHFYLTDPGHFFASHFWGYRGCHCEGLIVSERNEWPLRLKDPAVPPKHSCNLSD
jgi:hypothetical protein